MTGPSLSDELVERLRYCAEYGIFTAAENNMQASYAEAADRIQRLLEREERMREALTFYADEWEEHPDPEASGINKRATYRLRYDEGDIARTTLSGQEQSQ